MVNEAHNPAIRPPWIRRVPTPRGRFTDAKGLTGRETLTDPEIFRLPAPETEQTSFGFKRRRSETFAGMTKSEIIAAGAVQSEGWFCAVGNAFTNSIVMA